MMADPYILPKGNVHIGLSGGRSSAYMLNSILKANGDLPSRVVVTFENTGREMPQTLDFVAEIQNRWRVDVVWLEYLPQKPLFRQVDIHTASRDGEPFEALIERKKYLPNQQTRFCTIELKIRVAKRYLRSIGWDHWTNTTGIRADEPSRVKTAEKPTKDRWVNWTPMAHAGVSKHDVALFWGAQPFDLRLPNVKGNCWLGNCDGCFLKSESNLAALAREYPDRHDWWERMEMRASNLTSGTADQWSKRYTRRELKEFMDRQSDAFDVNDGQLCQASGGECVI